MSEIYLSQKFTGSIEELMKKEIADQVNKFVDDMIYDNESENIYAQWRKSLGQERAAWLAATIYAEAVKAGDAKPSINGIPAKISQGISSIEIGNLDRFKDEELGDGQDPGSHFYFHDV